MADTVGKRSPRALARLTGALYLYIMVAAMFAEAFVRGKLVVPGNAAATSHNIAAAEPLWRWGVAANVSTTLADVAVAALLFVLLRQVNRTTAITAAFFRLAYSATMAASTVFLIAPLLLLGAAGAGPAQALTLFAIRLHDASFNVALTLFGVHLILTGALIARSKFLPALLGLALAVAGACYLANSFIGFVAPGLASSLFPWLLLPGFLAEGGLTLWLLIAGVNPARWLPAP